MPGTATTVALLTQDAQQGMAWLWFQAGVGKIRGMRRGTTTTTKNHLLPATKDEEGELGGEREAASGARCSPAVTPGEQSESEQPY